jgi:hypothetical protein
MVSATQTLTGRQVQIAVGISVAIFVAVVLVNALDRSTRIRDFACFYAAARIVNEGEGARLYDLQKQTEVEKALFHWGRPLVLEHPPFEAWLFAPLAPLPYTVAYTMWGMLNIALWVFFVYLVRPYDMIPRNPFQYLFLCFLFFPVWVALMQGQTSILLLVLLSSAFICLKRRREGWAGVLVGLGLFKFAVAVPLALIFLLRGKWRLIAGFGGAAIMLGVVSLLTVGPVGILSYVNLLLDMMRRPNYYPRYGTEVWMMPNLRGFFHVTLAPLFPGSTINGVVVLVSVFLIGYVAWRWRGQGAGEGPSLDLMFAAALVISQVTAYHLMIHDLSPTLLAVLLTLGSARYPEGSAWRPMRTFAIAALYVFPLCLPRWALTPVLVVLAWAAMAGSALPLEGGEPRLAPDR